MTVPSVHCEARKVAYRQTKEGLVVAFVIHPNDMPDALAVAPLGQRYMLALAAIGDDEQPLGTETFRKEVVPDNQPQPSRLDNAKPPSSEAGASAASQRGKERYAASTEMQQALVRAARLPKDTRYQEWISRRNGWGKAVGDAAFTEELAVNLLRKECNIGSRSEIAENEHACKRFLQHELAYKMATGQMAEIR